MEIAGLIGRGGNEAGRTHVGMTRGADGSLDVPPGKRPAAIGAPDRVPEPVMFVENQDMEIAGLIGRGGELVMPPPIIATDTNKSPALH